MNKFSIKIETRYEKKAVFNNSLDLKILNTLSKFKKEYPSREVFNIYFDSPDFKSFYNHVEGINERVKYRARWYFDSKIQNSKLKINSYNLEIKKKINDITEKHSYGNSNNNINRAFQSYGIAPVLLNRYHRDYYINREHNLRMTVDTEINYQKINYIIDSDGVNINNVIHDHKTILEFKFDINQSQNDLKFLGSFGMQFDKYSKYVSGMEAVLKY